MGLLDYLIGLLPKSTYTIDNSPEAKNKEVNQSRANAESYGFASPVGSPKVLGTNSVTPMPQNMAQYIPSPTPSPTMTPNPTPTTQQPASLKDIERKIIAQYKQYGGDNLPALQYVPAMMDEIGKSKFLQDNPYLIPQIIIAETSGGRNITRPNNLVNWGINVPGNNEAFSKMTPEQVLRIAMTGIGTRSGIYKKYRTGKPMTEQELIDFAKTYEPTNGDYPNILKYGIQGFANQ